MKVWKLHRLYCGMLYACKTRVFLRILKYGYWHSEGHVIQKITRLVSESNERETLYTQVHLENFKKQY